MPTPPYSITITPKGKEDYYASLIQSPYPTETFEANRNGFLQDIPALGNRARQTDVQPLINPIVLGRQEHAVVVPASTWTPIPFDMIDINYDTWYNSSLGQFSPRVGGYYRVNLKITLTSTNFNSASYLRVLQQGSQMGANRFDNNIGLATPISLYFNKYIYVYADSYLTFEVYTAPDATTVAPFNYTDFFIENENYLEITR